MNLAKHVLAAAMCSIAMPVIRFALAMPDYTIASNSDGTLTNWPQCDRREPRIPPAPTP